MTTSSRKRNILRRGMSFMLLLMFVLANISSFTAKTSASETGLTVGDVLYNAGKEIFDTMSVGLLGYDEFIRLVQYTTDIDVMAPADSNTVSLNKDDFESVLNAYFRVGHPGSGVTFFYDGKGLVVQYHSVDSIKIGNFIFPRSPNYITGSDVLAWQEYIVGSNPQSFYYHIPFFIYENELYVNWEYISATYHDHVNRVTYSIAKDSQTAYFPEESSYYYSLDYVNFRYYGIYSMRAWNNLPYEREITGTNNKWVNVNNPVFGNGNIVPQDVLPNIDKSNVSDFIPNSGHFGMFVVTPDFVEITGMQFPQYLLSLYYRTDLDNVYEQQPPTDIDEYIPFPESLHDIGDNDVVNITVDGDGNVIFDVTPGTGGDGGNGGSGNYMDILERILAELKKILRSIELVYTGVVHILDYLLTILPQILDELKNIVKNTSGLIDVEETSGDDSFIYYISKGGDSLFSLVKKISNNSFDSVLDFFKPIVDFFLNLKDKMFELLIYLFVPDSSTIKKEFLSVQTAFDERFSIVSESNNFLENLLDYIKASNDSDIEVSETQLMQSLEAFSTSNDDIEVVEYQWNDYPYDFEEVYFLPKSFDVGQVFIKANSDGFTIFNEIIAVLHSYKLYYSPFIIFFAYLFFAIKVLKEIPSMIRGI